MSRGKHLNLEEARKKNQMERFAKEHPSKGDKRLFDRLFQAMVKNKSLLKDIFFTLPVVLICSVTVVSFMVAVTMMAIIVWVEITSPDWRYFVAEMAPLFISPVIVAVMYFWLSASSKYFGENKPHDQ